MSQTDSLEDLTDCPITLAHAMERIDELRNRLDVTERALDISADTVCEYNLVLKLAHESDIPAALFDRIEAVLYTNMGVTGEFSNFDLWLETRE